MVLMKIEIVEEGSEKNLEEDWKVEGFYWIKKTRRGF